MDYKSKTKIYLVVCTNELFKTSPSCCLALVIIRTKVHRDKSSV